MVGATGACAHDIPIFLKFPAKLWLDTIVYSDVNKEMVYSTYRAWEKSKTYFTLYKQLSLELVFKKWKQRQWNNNEKPVICLHSTTNNTQAWI